MLDKGKHFLLLTVSTLIMAIGTYFFKFTNNFTFGGITGLDLLGLVVGDVDFDGEAAVGHVDGGQRLLLAADGLAGRSVDGRNGAGHAGFDLQLIRILAQLVDLRLLAFNGFLVI